VFVAGIANRPADAEPVADHGDVAEGNTRLRHAERPRIHSHEEGLLGTGAVPLQIGLMRGTRVVERVVHLRDWRIERQRVDVPAQPARNPD